MGEEHVVLEVQRAGSSHVRYLYMRQHCFGPNGERVKPVRLPRSRRMVAKAGIAPSMAGKGTRRGEGSKARKGKRMMITSKRGGGESESEASSDSESSSSSSSSSAEGSAGSDGPFILFVTNLDADWDKAEIRALFDDNVGFVVGVAVSELVDEDDMVGPVRAAHVVFENRNALKRALMAVTMTMPARTDGLAAWMEASRRNRRMQPSGMRRYLAKVEKQVADYDAKKAAEAAELKKAQEAAAEEGWTLVVSGKNHNKVRAADGTVVKAAGGRASAQGRLRKSRKRSKKTKAPVLDFYRMHRNERKKSEIAELRERFDADKARIEAMRARKRYG